VENRDRERSRESLAAWTLSSTRWPNKKTT